MTVVEATSGNTGISMAFFARQKGYDVTIAMPRNMSEERKRIIRNLGANLVLCSKGMVLRGAATGLARLQRNAIAR